MCMPSFLRRNQGRDKRRRKDLSSAHIALKTPAQKSCKESKMDLYF